VEGRSTDVGRGTNQKKTQFEYKKKKDKLETCIRQLGASKVAQEN